MRGVPCTDLDEWMCGWVWVGVLCAVGVDVCGCVGVCGVCGCVRCVYGCVRCVWMCAGGYCVWVLYVCVGCAVCVGVWCVWVCALVVQYVPGYVGLAVTKLLGDDNQGPQLQIMCMNIVLTALRCGACSHTHRKQILHTTNVHKRPNSADMRSSVHFMEIQITYCCVNVGHSNHSRVQQLRTAVMSPVDSQGVYVIPFNDWLTKMRHFECDVLSSSVSKQQKANAGTERSMLHRPIPMQRCVTTLGLYRAVFLLTRVMGQVQHVAADEDDGLGGRRRGRGVAAVQVPCAVVHACTGLQRVRTPGRCYCRMWVMDVATRDTLQMMLIAQRPF